MFHAFPPPNFWILHTDGSAMPNLGRMGIGAVLTGPDGASYQVHHSLPERGCNNEAELRALHAGLQLATQHGCSSLRIYTDSQWLQEQLAPSPVQKKVRPTVRLDSYLQQVRQVLTSFAQVHWRWIPRHCNTQADALARQAASAGGEKELPHSGENIQNKS